jgi:ubiquitin carboxyl-terminal hydrolase 9/13
VRNFFGGEGVLACAYVLFYQETTEEAMMAEQEADGLAAAKQATELNQEAISVTTPKANGAPQNGFIHPLHQAQTPTIEEEDQFASLNHAATAPALAPHEHYPIEHVSTNIPTTHQHTTQPLAGRKSSLGLFKKDKATAEKEKAQRAADKELEKQAKQKRKEMEAQRRENYRKQEDDLKAALAASKESKNEEDSRRRGTGAGDDVPPTPTFPHTPTTATAGTPTTSTFPTSGSGLGSPAQPQQALGKPSGLSRFRHSSMSLKGKPKFWGGKDKADAVDEAIGEGAEEREDGGKERDGAKEKGRFGGLGRKKSTFKF